MSEQEYPQEGVGEVVHERNDGEGAESSQPRVNQRRPSQQGRRQPSRKVDDVVEAGLIAPVEVAGDSHKSSPLPPLEAFVPSAKEGESEPRRQPPRQRIARSKIDPVKPENGSAVTGKTEVQEPSSGTRPRRQGTQTGSVEKTAAEPASVEAQSLPSISVGQDASSSNRQANYLARIKQVKASMPAPKVGDVIPADEVERIQAKNAQATRRPTVKPRVTPDAERGDQQSSSQRKRKRYGRTKGERERFLAQGPVVYSVPEQLANSIEADGSSDRRANQRVGRQRNGRPVGRYLMCVQVKDDVTQIAVLEGRTLIEHYVSRDSDNQYNIDGNIYLGRVTNVLPGMEAAFVDIGTSKNAVLYRGDVRYERDDIENGDRSVRIEQLLRPKQTVICQVTKNPIGSKGARLTQEVSLPGRFVVLIPNSNSYGISKRLPDDERKRLRRILDEIKPEGFGVIVRTAAEGASADELTRDVGRLKEIWEKIETRARMAHAPTLLYREPQVALRVVREEFNRNYRGIIINNSDLFEEVVSYVSAISPELANRVEFYENSDKQIPMFEAYHVHEQLHKALERKVWLPSGGSIVIDRAEALTVIDVNTGKNVGSVSLEETIHRNNLEAVEEIARQLRLRDIGGIIVIDFIDMLIKENRDDVMRAFRAALARDKTKTHVYDMSQLGLVEMTRQRVSEGLVEAFSQTCPNCGGRGIIFDQVLL